MTRAIADLAAQPPEQYEINQPPAYVGQYEYNTIYRNPADTGGMGVTSDGMISLGNSYNNYAYPEVVAPPGVALFSATISAWVYCGITSADAAPGDVVSLSNGVGRGPNGEYPNPTDTGDNERYERTTYFFQDGGPGAYHEWKPAGSWLAGSTPGAITLGPKIGSTHLEPPPELSEPPAPPANYPESDYTLNGSDIVGIYGYAVINQKAKVHWSFTYTGPTHD